MKKHKLKMICIKNSANKFTNYERQLFREFGCNPSFLIKIIKS